MVRGHDIPAPLATHLRPARTHGLVGHDRSGKSTLMQRLARKVPPTGGTLAFQGVGVALEDLP
ncbi:hypothetical protein GCM10007301_14900 [Azorhizobium oxalatiphilum]|uniref:ABC transporter domain-containing protein n=1 Tax=Azorhizobium oxalatiphilum TaxID=980631 RepID=A0A917F8V6_9HYPH|nr:hypothetical protein GCM10007301_14900 [Azorhizobium oxalatiphilum]